MPLNAEMGAQAPERDESRPYDKGHRPRGVPYNPRSNGVGVRTREETVLLPYEPIQGGLVSTLASTRRVR
jgi:hypothetical protein